jgi:hypothetical protein
MFLSNVPPLGYHGLGALGQDLAGRRFRNNEKMKTAVRE